MNALVCGLVLAAAGSTEVDGALTAGVQVAAISNQRNAQALAHGRVDLSRDFGRFFVVAHGSLLMRGSAEALGFTDLGSRLTLGYRPTGFVKRVALEVLPFNPAARLASFDWANAWGLPSPLDGLLTPVVTAEVSTEVGSMWLAVRFKSVLNVLTQHQVLRPDVLGGVDLPLPSGLLFEVRGAFLSGGPNPALALQGLPLEHTGGVVGARLSWTWNEAVGPAIDLRTYAADPLRFERFFTSEPRRSSTAAWLALEGGGGGQQLRDRDLFSDGKTEVMGWADAQARVRLRELRLFGTMRVQSLTFLVFDAKGIPPGFAFAAGMKTSPQLAALVGADWTFRSLKLTPGVLLSVSQPSWVRMEQFDLGGTNPPPGLGLPRTVYLRPDGRFGSLAPGKEVAPFLNATVSLRWELVAFASLVAEVDVEKDPNAYTFSQEEPVGSLVLGSTEVTTRGQLFLQARF